MTGEDTSIPSPVRYCGARKKHQPDKTCTRPAGWGTVHLGWGHCKLHGGAAPNGLKYANRLQAEWEMEQARIAVMGTALDVEPMDALLWCVRITAGEVAYATQKVQALEPDEEIVRPITEIERQGGGANVADAEKQIGQEELNLWIKIRMQAVDRLAKFSKMALDAGVAERLVQQAEYAGEGLALAIRSILLGLDLSYEQEQKAPELVRAALEMLEGPNTAGQALLSDG